MKLNIIQPYPSFRKEKFQKELSKNAAANTTNSTDFVEKYNRLMTKYNMEKEVRIKLEAIIKQRDDKGQS